MACFLLFGAFMDEFSEFSGRKFDSVDIATPEVLIGGLIGSMLIFLFTGLAISAVGRTAHEVVLEVRRQFEESPDIMTYNAKPDYERCVGLVTRAALREMRLPGLMCVVTPIMVGICFRLVGERTDRPLLGAEVLASYLMFGTVTGILMALFLDTGKSSRSFRVLEPSTTVSNVCRSLFCSWWSVGQRKEVRSVFLCFGIQCVSCYRSSCFLTCSSSSSRKSNSATLEGRIQMLTKPLLRETRLVIHS